MTRHAGSGGAEPTSGEGHAESIGAFLRAVAVPRRKAFFALHAVALLVGAEYWVGSFLYEAHLPLAVRVLYEPEGDTQYFALVSGLARGILGEIALVDSFRSGLQAFPWGALALHAACIAVFGDAGFAVASALAGLLFFLSLVALFRAVGLSDTWSRLGAIFTASGLATASVAAVAKIVPLPVGLESIWWKRIPRPFVTNASWLTLLALTILVATRPRVAERWTSFAGLGVALALVVQSDVYAAAMAGPVAGVVVTGLVVRAAFVDRKAAVRRGLAFVGAFAIGVVPFVVQRLLAHPDVIRRFGVFTLPRSSVPLPPPEWAGRLVWVTLLLALAFACVSPGALRRRNHRALGMLGLVAVSAWGAMPLTVLVTGKAVQLYHFQSGWLETTSYLLIATSLTVLRRASEWVSAVGSRLVARWSLELGGRRGVVRVAAIGLVTALSLRAALADGYTLETDRLRVARGVPYKRDLTALVRELETQRYDAHQVLLTFDEVVYTHWVASRRRFAFLPDPFTSTRTDAEQETRLMAAFGELGVGAAAFPTWVEDWNTQVLWLSHAKYIVSRGHGFAPPPEYPEAVRPVILGGSWFKDWTLAVPPREAERLTAAYRGGAWKGHPFRRADIVILSPPERAQGLSPGPDFVRTYQNPTFDVWLRH